MSNPVADNPAPDESAVDGSAFNPWQLKPWWCQPWSILLTAIALVGGSWLVGHRWWLTLLVAVPVGVWMGFFLLLWPRLMRDMLQAEVAQSSPKTD